MWALFVTAATRATSLAFATAVGGAVTMTCARHAMHSGVHCTLATPLRRSTFHDPLCLQPLLILWLGLHLAPLWHSFEWVWRSQRSVLASMMPVYPGGLQATGAWWALSRWP